MVDIDGTRGVIWEHELYVGCELNQDRAFFLSFEGDQSMIGFIFADESEAKTFHKKYKSKRAGKSSVPRSDKKQKAAKGGKIDKSMISGPKTGSFIHVAHMGYDADSGFTSKGVDPSWTALLGNLEGVVGGDIVAREMEFIKNFAREYPEKQKAAAKEAKKPKPPPPTPRRYAANGSASSQTSPTFHAPPPTPSCSQNGGPPPSPSSRQQNGGPPPPPPSQSRAHMDGSDASAHLNGSDASAHLDGSDSRPNPEVVDTARAALLERLKGLTASAHPIVCGM